MDLTSQVSNIKSIGPIYLKRLERLGINTVEELLNHIPSRYEDYSLVKNTQEAQIGEIVTIKGVMSGIKNQFTKRGLRMQIGAISDAMGRMQVIWFNQPFLAKMLYPGKRVSLSGKVQFFSGHKALVSPEYEMINEDEETTHTGHLVPVYPETSGLSSKWLRSKMKLVFESTKDSLQEFLPKEVLKKYDLEKIGDSYKNIHFPEKIKEVDLGRKRIAFNEFLLLQLKSLVKKLDWNKNESTYKLNCDRKLVDEFIQSLPFKLTASQEISIKEILSDISQKSPMNRLLEGDVGSGKTVVAAVAAFVSFLNGYQTIFMAPTQILAQQHFETLNKLFDKYKIRISLITSGIKKSDLGRSDIFVGTHALIHKKLDLDKVALVVIDEQHRFGVEQRQHLIKRSGKKKLAPHVLTMTATPIPRTIALTLYGDLDLSILKDMPKGRIEILTKIVPQEKRKVAYSWIEDQIKKEKSQAFIICPLIEESLVETMQDIKSAKKEFESLKTIFKGLKLGLLHGKLSAKQKDEVLSQFRSGVIDILVSTPVVEVGIDVPNATIMMIEASERFGLAQLHQLRGRVGRGKKKSYCLLFSNIKYSKRLSAMTKTSSGFELAELDLKLRGPGEIFGTMQHGFDNLKVASWSDTDLIKKTKEVALDFTKNPAKYPNLGSRLERFLHVA